MTNGQIEGCLQILNVRMETLKSAIETSVFNGDEVEFQFDRVLRAIEKLDKALHDNGLL